MGQTILSILGTSTPVSEQVARELGLVKAAIVCRVFFYQNLENGVCYASNKSFQDSLGLSGGAVSSNLKWLLDNGWIINVKPLAKGNRSNHYKVTKKFYDLLERSPNERSLSLDESNVHEMNGKEESKEEIKEVDEPNGTKPKLDPHEQDMLRDFGIYGQNGNPPEPESLEEEIVNSGWPIRSPLIEQALIAFLKACRESGLNLSIPNSDTMRKDWLKSLSDHTKDYDIETLESRYKQAIQKAKDGGWFDNVGRPGAFNKTLPTIGNTIINGKTIQNEDGSYYL